VLHKLHRTSAVLIGTFLLFHLINHAFILKGLQQHIDFMEILRTFYRYPLVEFSLLACILFQVCSGAFFVWKRRGQRRSFFEKIQVISGLYLIYFFLNHVGAVLFGRILLDLDTNIYYGIAGLHIKPFHYYFVPYYFFAILALFVHLASAFNWLSRDTINEALRIRLSYFVIVVGGIMSTVLMLGFSGSFYEIKIPSEYSATFE